MFLRSLTIKGFKSFADSVTLQLEPGVTVVVGPNGSGKSNVVDAIAWVLGAQAPSAVRSQKMDDVIFAGTSKRPALGRAEVSLTIDNSAGLLPIAFTEVTITRTLFRSGDSEYAINGVPCRLLDVQELLSDSGVGRQQHVIVSQGQIDAVLNARPEERRAIIEEAAGVLKHRKRREKAQRRLDATEANLLRVQDLLREVRRQLRPLERQAEAARRHGDLVAELGALQVHLAGREIAGLRSRVETLGRERATLESAERDLKAQLARLDSAVLAAEAELAAVGGADVTDELRRVESLRERARGLAAVLAERRRSLERDRGGLMDAGVVATLEGQAADLRRELEAVERERDALGPMGEELAEAEAALAAERERFAEVWGDGVPPTPSGAAAEVRGELAALRATVQRTAAEQQRAAQRRAQLTDRHSRLAAEAARLRAEHDGAAAQSGDLARRAAQAEEALAAAERALAAAEPLDREAEAERNRWAARADALALALDEARAAAGANRLASVEGVVGTLLDLVDVDAGWEAAFEAAAGEALRAVVLRDADGGRRAVEALLAGDLSGAVLPLGQAAVPPPTGPAGAERVLDHVRGRDPDVAGVLATLVGNAFAVPDWRAGATAALDHPDLVFVTADGHRFARSGWRVGAAGSGATGAALEEARTRADEAAVVAAERRSVAVAARDALAVARREQAEAARAAEGNRTAVSALADRIARLDADLRDLTAELDALDAAATDLAERAGRERERVAELEQRLPALEAEEAEAVDEARRLAEARARLEARAASVGAQRAELRTRAARVEERTAMLTRRLAEVEQRLARDRAERLAAEDRRVRIDRALAAVGALAAVVDRHLATVAERAAQLQEVRRRQTERARAIGERLDGLRRQRHASERQLEELRERAQRAEIEAAEVRLRLDAAVEALRQQHDLEPEAAMAAELPELPPGVGPAQRVRELERELRLLGPINPLALEEFSALQERHQFLESQLDDVKTTRRDLARVIKAVDAEIRSVFASAYADVAEHFSSLFATLFPGGVGRLVLTEPDDLLNTGIEIEAKPSGKNVKKLSLLSGGERSLTALAFLFAVFRARPSPFYVMDEVEAALDDVNLHRFLGLVAEFRSDAQLVIVSHQKRTMEAADCLIGVTMQPGGSSKVVSEKVSAH